MSLMTETTPKPAPTVFDRLQAHPRFARFVEAKTSGMDIVIGGAQPQPVPQDVDVADRSEGDERR
jgi:hypothetical protein